MEAAQIRNAAAESRIENKKLAKGEHNEAARIAEHEPVESAADITREAAAEFLNEKPMQQTHERNIENQLREKQNEMLWLGRTEKQGEEERILRRNPEIEEGEKPGFVGEQPYKAELDKELKRINKEENPEQFRQQQKNDYKQYDRFDLGQQIEESKDKVGIEQPEAKNKKHQHKKLSSKQLQKHQQELEETENVHMTQKREELEPQSPSSSSGDSAEKENRFEQQGRIATGDIASKQMGHTEPFHKKQREFQSEGEEKHLFAQEKKHQVLKDQQAPKGLKREGRQSVRHHPKPDKEAPRLASPASTTSSSASEGEENYGERHELVNKNLHRDHPEDQEILHRGGKLGRIQDAQARQTHLPTKNKQSEDDKRMSSTIGAQLPLKQEARPIEQKEASTLRPSQKKDFAPPQ